MFRTIKSMTMSWEGRVLKVEKTWHSHTSRVFGLLLFLLIVNICSVVSREMLHFFTSALEDG